MVGARGDWWLGHDGRWRRGFPPPGWRCARDGTWHPPDHGPEGAAESLNVSGGIYGTPTTEMPHVAYPDTDGPYGTQGFGPARPVPDDRGEGPDRRRPPGTRRRLPPFSSWPWLARVATPALAALIALAGLLIAGEMFRDGDSAPKPAFGHLGPSASTPVGLDPMGGTTSTSTSTTSTTEATSTTPPTTTGRSPATPPPPPPTSEPPDAGVHYRNCNQARALGAAPLHPGDRGYDPALDSNGNGVACDGGDSSHPGRP
ncbi:MAG TPA: excalibur calcium-binding domain-containing protein [Acidimicrobiales bacterium]